MFVVNEKLSFEKHEGGVSIIVDGVVSFTIDDNTWVSIMTSMSYKPDDADLYSSFNKLHFK